MSHKIFAPIALLLALTLCACAGNGLQTGAIAPGGFSASSTGLAAASSTPMPEMEAAAPPAGFIGFCMRFADQCKTPEGAPAQIVLTTQNWQTLAQVNQQWNDDVWQEEDEKHYGRSEYWTIPTDGYGDCEDIALAKRKQLMTLGVPGPALRIAVVLTPRHENHAVLTVATDRGDYVLDSMRDEILPWERAGYTWIERQDPTGASGWVSLVPNRLALDSSAAKPKTEMAKAGDYSTAAQR